jgi:iron complex transport system substrate-binding protein
MPRISNRIETALPRRAALRAMSAVALLPLMRGWADASVNRIVSIGGAVTEIVFELGHGGKIVAVDTTSTYPPDVSRLPNVGYMRALSAEGVLALNPNLILASADSGPPEVLSILGASDVPVTLVPARPTIEGIKEKVRVIAERLDDGPRGEALNQAIAARFADLAARVAKIPTRPRTLFILTLSDGRIMAGGAETAADKIIELAGGANVARDFNGYKNMSAEAIVAAAPEAILMMHGREHAKTPESLFSETPFATLPAARDRRLILMDGSYLLGFGPRTPDAARELARALHPALAL